MVVLLSSLVVGDTRIIDGTVEWGTAASVIRCDTAKDWKFFDWVLCSSNI